MRFPAPVIAALLLAACGTTPKPVAGPTRPVAESPHIRSDLIGMHANELSARLGRPRLQVREGDGTKLQFAVAECVLDAYLYPPESGSGAARVTHVDTRTREGRTAEQSSCIAAIEAR